MGCPQRLLWRDLVLRICRGGAVSEAKPASPLAAGSPQTFACNSPQAFARATWTSDLPIPPFSGYQGQNPCTQDQVLRVPSPPPPTSQPQWLDVSQR